MYVITGGGRGLGRALALALAAQGQQVLIVGRNEQALQDTAALAPQIQYRCADVSSPKDRTSLTQFLSQQAPIQGLIHNAGVIEPIATMQAVTLETWRACLATNLEAPLFLTQSLLPYLNQARVLHIGSGAAYFPIKGWSAYCVSKAGLAMLTRGWLLENPELCIASVMPGIVDTDMQTVIRHATAMDVEKLEFFIHLKETGHLLTPETVASFLVWLLCEVPAATYVSQEWDIYDTSHHAQWLCSPHAVPAIEG